MSAELELAGLRAKTVKLSMPESGVWCATVELEGVGLPLTGAVVLRIGSAECACTIDPSGSGSYLVHSKARVIGGAGGWQKRIGSRAYHNDAGVSIASVVSSTAALIGETLAAPLPTGRTNADYVRPEGVASEVLYRLTPGWWVGLDGQTRTSPRAPSNPTKNPEIKAFDIGDSVATLAVDSITDIDIGSLIDIGNETRKIRAFDLVAAGETRVYAWVA